MQPRKLVKRKPPRNLGLFAIGIVVALVILALGMPTPNTKQVDLTEIIQKAKAEQFTKLIIEGNNITAVPKDQTAPRLTASKEDPSISITQYGIKPEDVTIETKNPNSGAGRWVDVFIYSLFPVIIIMGFFYFMMRQAQGNSQQALGFGKSKARVFGGDGQKTRITFNNVAGVEEAKDELAEIVEFLKNPKKFLDLGARIPKGVLMVGAPGTGKTLLARAVAGEAKVPFFNISASEFVEMFVGVGASRVRDLFMKAKKNSPCIIFIDEIDAVGRRRGSGMGGGHDEREQTLNQILVEMDGFEPGANVIVLAATNRPDVLDSALLRPGRFDRQVLLDLPDRKDRLAILKVHLKNKPLGKNIRLDNLAGKTAGMSGADLSNVANEAAIVAARANRKSLSNADLDEAFEKVAIGPARKSKVMSKQERELTAYHEGGHALVGHVLPDADPIHKVSIISRGGAGGVTWSLPIEDRNYNSLSEFKDMMAVAMGGRVAEEVMYGPQKITTGSSSDFKKATQLARDMVVKYGMSASLPNQSFADDDHSFLIDKDFVHSRQYSDATAQVIDSEVRRFLKEATERARKVIKANRRALDRVAQELLKKESLEADDIQTLLKGAKAP